MRSPIGERSTTIPSPRVFSPRAKPSASITPPTASLSIQSQIVLTTSTSEAYSFLFRLLCDPGDEILIPQPGYPLFDFLADLDDVRLKAAPLVTRMAGRLMLKGFAARSRRKLAPS